MHVCVCVRRGVKNLWAEKFIWWHHICLWWFFYQRDPSTTTPMKEVCWPLVGLDWKINFIWSHSISHFWTFELTFIYIYICVCVCVCESSKRTRMDFRVILFRCLKTPYPTNLISSKKKISVQWMNHSLHKAKLSKEEITKEFFVHRKNRSFFFLSFTNFSLHFKLDIVVPFSSWRERNRKKVKVWTFKFTLLLFFDFFLFNSICDFSFISPPPPLSLARALSLSLSLPLSLSFSLSPIRKRQQPLFSFICFI